MQMQFATCVEVLLLQSRAVHRPNPFAVSPPQKVIANRLLWILYNKSHGPANLLFLVLEFMINKAQLQIVLFVEERELLERRFQQ